LASDWTTFREQYFPITKHWVFLDHAAVAPLSLPAAEALRQYAEDLCQHGDAHEDDWDKRIQQVRVLAAALLHADPSEIAFVKNTSEAINFVAQGLDWRPGDNVLVAREEYPSNIYPWLNLHRYGVEVRLIPTRDARIWLDDIRAQIDQRTRLVSLSYVEFSSGFRNDLDAVGELCRQRGILFFVDAIQGLGVLPLDVRRMPVDFCAADGHKWLLGPEGAGLFYVRACHLERLYPIEVGWRSVLRDTEFSVIDFRLKPHAGRFECGSYNVGGLTALGASIELIVRIGVENISARVLELTDLLCERLTTHGWPVYSSRLERDKSGIVAVECPADPRQAVRHCRQHGIILNQRAGRLRISPHFYNTVEELEHTVAVLNHWRRKLS